MNLASVQALKLELRERPRRLAPVERVPSPASFAGRAAFAPAHPAPAFALNLRCALGVAAGTAPGDFRLGVRLQGPYPAALAWSLELLRLTRGECDVRLVAPIRAQAKPARYFQQQLRPLEAGASVGNYATSAGSIGCIVEDDFAHYILSNHHVLAGPSVAESGDPVVQPGPTDAEPTEETVVGALSRVVPLSERRVNLVDCALARIIPGLEFWDAWNESIGGRRGQGGRLTGARRLTPRDLGRPVTKVGRTTGITEGVVQLVDLDDLEVNLGQTTPRVVTFKEQIEIAGKDGSVFSRNGDSGSLVVDDAGYAVGLLFAGSDYSYANHVDEALRQLRVRLAL